MTDLPSRANNYVHRLRLGAIIVPSKPPPRILVAAPLSLGLSRHVGYHLRCWLSIFQLGTFVPQRMTHRWFMRIAVFLAGAMIALAIVFVFRWEMTAAGSAAYRLDRWTGEIAACNLGGPLASGPYHGGIWAPMRCSLPSPDQIKSNALDPATK